MLQRPPSLPLCGLCLSPSHFFLLPFLFQDKVIFERWLREDPQSKIYVLKDPKFPAYSVLPKLFYFLLHKDTKIKRNYFSSSLAQGDLEWQVIWPFWASVFLSAYGGSNFYPIVLSNLLWIKEPLQVLFHSKVSSWPAASK